MILTNDYGNTNITFGVIDGDKLSFVSRLATERNRTDDQFAVEFLAVFKVLDLEPAEITGAVLSSVVPELTGKIKTAVNKVSGIESVIIAPGLKTGLNILIDNPAELGAVLVAGAVGAMARYEMPAFVIDLGTATKIYAVDEHGG